MKTKILIALILGLAASPSYAQNHTGYKAPKKDKAELQKTKRILQDMSISMYRKEPSSWLDISSAPSFPLPLFRGNQTKFFKPKAAAAAFLENSHSHNITLSSRDSAATVYQFYASALPAAGFVIDNKYPNQVAKARIYVLKGDSPKSCASVTIAPKDDPTGPGAQITITVFDRPAAAVAAAVKK